MQKLIIVLLIFISAISFAQNNPNPHVLFNGNSTIINARINFPLTNESFLLDSENIFKLISQNPKRKIFYCYGGFNRSRIYNLNDEGLNENDALNFIIPNDNYYQNLYKERICPFCHKTDSVISVLYGKPFWTDDLRKKVINKEVIVTGNCDVTNASPWLYCKRDKAYF